MTASAQSVLFISHEASRTGAPLLRLNFARWFREKAGIPFAVLLRRDGPLRGAFESVAPTFVFYPRRSLRLRLAGKLARFGGRRVPWMSDPAVPPRIRRMGPIGLIYSNTVANGGVLELVRDDGGVVVPCLDADAMAEAVRQLLGDDERRRTLGENLRKRVLRDHTIETIGPRIMSAMAKCAPGFEELQKWRG